MTKQQAKGCANEYVVIADLLSRGFFVFPSATANCPYDMLVVKEDVVIKVEVKANRSSIPRGNVVGSTPQTKDCHTPDCRKFDILAAVDGTSVRYLRSILRAECEITLELTGPEFISSCVTAKNKERLEAMRPKENQ